MGNLSPRIADLRNPGAKNWDLSLFKEFGMREFFRLQLRGEFLNGFISRQGNSPRQTQIGLKPLW